MAKWPITHMLVQTLHPTIQYAYLGSRIIFRWPLSIYAINPRLYSADISGTTLYAPSGRPAPWCAAGHPLVSFLSRGHSSSHRDSRHLPYLGLLAIVRFRGPRPESLICFGTTSLATRVRGGSSLASGLSRNPSGGLDQILYQVVCTFLARFGTSCSWIWILRRLAFPSYLLNIRV